jgi:uncharacterized membrane protein YfcA
VLELAAFGALCFVLAVAGGLAGLVLGNLRLPFAVAASETVSAGGGANVAISGVAALAATIAHVRAGRVNWRMFGWLAPASLVGGFGGGLAANAVPGDSLRLLIAAVLFYGAWELARWRSPAPEQTDPDLVTGPPVAQPPVAQPSVAQPPMTPIGLTTAKEKLVISAIGLVVGALGGAVGLILGSLRMPALLRFTAERPQMLVGTNLAAGVLVGIAGAVGHLTAGAEGFDLRLFVVGAICSAPGAWFGARLTGRLSTAALVRAIALIVFAAAVMITVQAFD